jgi:hypothetical protein
MEEKQKYEQKGYTTLKQVIRSRIIISCALDREKKNRYHV